MDSTILPLLSDPWWRFGADAFSWLGGLALLYTLARVAVRLIRSLFVSGIPRTIEIVSGFLERTAEEFFESKTFQIQFNFFLISVLIVSIVVSMSFSFQASESRIVHIITSENPKVVVKSAEESIYRILSILSGLYGVAVFLLISNLNLRVIRLGGKRREKSDEQ